MSVSTRNAHELRIASATSAEAPAESLAAPPAALAPAPTVPSVPSIPSVHAGDRVIYERPATLVDRSTHYCPGCGHGVIHRLIAEVLDELALAPRTIAVAPVGCSVFAYDYLNVDFIEAPHGRAPAVGTGVRRVRPDNFVLIYQGDGDLAAIGTAEIIHAAARGELISAIFVNNGIYGMTGGQMAPTTLLGQRTTSSPTGREAILAGFPIRITEMLAQLPGVAYASRGTIIDPSAIGKTKAMIKRAFQVQLEGTGFAIVEILANCPVGWNMTPQDSIGHLAEVVETYPVGLIVDRGKEAASAASAASARSAAADGVANSAVPAPAVPTPSADRHDKGGEA